MNPADGPASAAASAPRATLAERQIAAFEDALVATSPAVRVTWAIFALNVVLFGLMVAAGADPLSPRTEDLLRFGGDYGPRTLGGQPWRLLSNTFLHFGVVHLAFNLFVLAKIGPRLERLFGSSRFLAVYLASALTGSVASVALHPQTVAAGASGAIFGLYGALLGFVVRQRHAIPRAVMHEMARVAIGFVAVNLVIGSQIEAIDNAAHLGGLLGGALSGLLLARPLGAGRAAESDRGRSFIVLASAATAALGVAASLPKPVDFLAEWNDFHKSGARLLTDFNQLAEQLGRRQITDVVFADRIEHELLPAWREARANLAPDHWPPSHQGLATLIVRYADAIERWWSDLAPAVRAHDEPAITRAQQHRTDADAITEQIARWKPR